MGNADKLFDMADKKAGELLVAQFGTTYYIESVQVKAVIWAVGQILDDLEDRMSKDIVRAVARAMQKY